MFGQKCLCGTGTPLVYSAPQNAPKGIDMCYFSSLFSDADFRPASSVSHIVALQSVCASLCLALPEGISLACPEDICFAGHFKGSHHYSKCNQCKKGTGCSRGDCKLWCQSWCTAEEEGFSARQSFLEPEAGRTQSIEGEVPCAGWLLSCA